MILDPVLTAGLALAIDVALFIQDGSKKPTDGCARQQATRNRSTQR